MIALTVPEMLRLLRLTGVSPARQAAGLHWSLWRRRHQAAARNSHIARRARTHPPPPRRPAPIIPLPGVPPLDEAIMGRLLAVLPPVATLGRPRGDTRRVLGGIVWLMRRGRPWREIPPEFGSWATIASRYRLWHKDGTWPRIATVLAAATAAPTP